MSSPSICFYAISDFGEHNKVTKSVAAAMDRYARTVKPPSFVLGLGDNFYPYGVEDSSDILFQTVWRNTFLCYPSLNVPWKMVLGNHDYMGIPQAEIDYHYDRVHNPDSLWHMPDRCYEFSHAVTTASSSSKNIPSTPSPSTPQTTTTTSASPALAASTAATPSDTIQIDFFALDTNGCQGHVQTTYKHVKKQLRDDIERLSQRLRASKAQWKIVFGHHPLYTQGLGHLYPSKCLRLPLYEVRTRDGSTNQKTGFDLERNLIEGGVDVYFAGHEHVFQVSTFFFFFFFSFN
jgi:tartrate-resistant acid phosphatase type 5